MTDQSKEFDLIGQIADRAVEISREQGCMVPNKLHFLMDIDTVHHGDCPLKLAELLAADNANFTHDVFGISNNLNRDSGELENCFLPRYAKPE